MIGQSIAQYNIVERLGVGGMGVVYKARDTRLKRWVALKFLPPVHSDDTEARERFVVEARAAAALDHPNICTIHEIGETDDGEPFIAMAYYAGRTLKNRQAQERLAIAEVLEIAASVAEALACAHGAAIIHRDVKPGNVILTERGEVKLLDFGLAKTQGVTLTQAGMAMGTVAYMSPEQAHGGPIDHRTDIWSWGVMFYEMLSGELPFRGASHWALLYSIVHRDPAPLASHLGIPEPVMLITTRALARDPARRFPDMASLLTELRGVQGVTPAPPVATAPPTAPAPLAATAPMSAALTPHPTPSNAPSIAVLPFADMSPGRDQDYFCEGVAEEILNALTRVRRLRVASRTSSFQAQDAGAREIGERLGVSSILEGSVRKAGNRLRVTVQLIGTADGYHLWSDRYDREIEDVFAVQDDIAESIVRALRGVLTDDDRRMLGEAQTASIEAYDYYLRGRQFLHQFRRSGMEHARQLFHRAVEADPEYAPAYAALAFCGYYLYRLFGHAKVDLQAADVASRKAVSLAPELAESHVARGLLSFALTERHAEAERALTTALRLNPDLYEANYFFARFCLRQGKLERAAELFERASEIDPQECQATVQLGVMYLGLGREEEARQQYWKGFQRAERRLEWTPDDARAVIFGGGCLLRVGERERGLEWIGRGLAMEPDDPSILYSAACTYAFGERYELALDCLEKAIELGFGSPGWLEHDPDLELLREHPRFLALLESTTKRRSDIHSGLEP